VFFVKEMLCADSLLKEKPFGPKENMYKPNF
jgi:hypothetical protein